MTMPRRQIGIRRRTSVTTGLCRVTALGWQKTQRARNEAAEAARLAACERAFRVMFLRAWAQGYLSRPLYPLLAAQSVVEKPVPEEEEPVVIDAAMRFLVQHPAELERELAAARVIDPAALEGFPGGARQQPGQARSADRPRLPDPVVSAQPPARRVTTPVSLREAIRETLDLTPHWGDRVLARKQAPPRIVADLHEAVEFAVLHPDNVDAQRTPYGTRLVQTGQQVYLLHDALLGQEDGRLLVGISLDGEPPRPVATERNMRDYLLRVRQAEANRERRAA